jgi:hypothetical protein
VTAAVAVVTLHHLLHPQRLETEYKNTIQNTNFIQPSDMSCRRNLI